MTALQASLEQLAQAIQPVDDPLDPAAALADVAKTFVAKRVTPGPVSLPIDDLQVDPDYQRPIDRDKVREFVRHRRAGNQLPAIKANMRPDGSLWITDGQHRAAAAAICGDDEIDGHVTHVPQHREAEETNIVTKVAEHRDTDAIAILFGAGARRDGKRVRLTLGDAGTVEYVPHGDQWVGKTERGQLTVDAPKARDVVDRLGLADLFLESGGFRGVA